MLFIKRASFPSSVMANFYPLLLIVDVHVQPTQDLRSLKTLGTLSPITRVQFTPLKNQPGSGIPLSLHFIFLEIIHAHNSLENQLWVPSEFTEAKGFPQENSHFFPVLAVYALQSRRQAFQIIPKQRQLRHCFPEKLLLFPKRVAGLRELASKLLQDNYESRQALSVFPMFSLCGPQPPHKANLP